MKILNLLPTLEPGGAGLEIRGEGPRRGAPAGEAGRLGIAGRPGLPGEVPDRHLAACERLLADDGISMERGAR